MNRAATSRAPASSANLGPGFDVLGLALALFNNIDIHCRGLRRRPGESFRDEIKLSISVQGEGADALPTDGSNLAFRAAAAVLERLGIFTEEMDIIMRNRIPLESGLGSSAAAIVGAMLAANYICGDKLERGELLNMAAELEGHGDNVAASMHGGLVAFVGDDNGPRALRLPLRDRYKVVAATPRLGLSTREARARLPEHISREDAIYSMARVALLCGLLASGEEKGFETAMSDRLHQPFRRELIPGLNEVIDAALKAGALGAALSGAGPSVIAILRKDDDARDVMNAMSLAFTGARVESRIRALHIDRRGARVKRMECRNIDWRDELIFPSPEL